MSVRDEHWHRHRHRHQHRLLLLREIMRALIRQLLGMIRMVGLMGWPFYDLFHIERSSGQNMWVLYLGSSYLTP
uniref:Uncharacterized protein n=1 Tax=Picea sitchensis TaxID=3332 RepID=A0A6B9XV55_PICSI|nr:hypothetical protein Q903MT_gene3908 [Picea sitchensis]